jgi:hypothetical protein
MTSTIGHPNPVPQRSGDAEPGKVGSISAAAELSAGVSVGAHPNSERADSTRMPRAPRPGWGARLRSACWLLPLLALGLVAQVVNLTRFPQRTDAEGVITVQAWALDTGARLAHSASWFDLPSAGWLQLAGWARLTEALNRSEHAVLGAREFMVVATLVSAILLWFLARRLGFARPVAAVATALFLLSPLALELHRPVSLDTVATVWLLVALVLTTARRRQRLAFAGASAAVAICVLTSAAFVVALPLLAWLLCRNAQPPTRRSSLIIAAGVLVAIAGGYLLAASATGESGGILIAGAGAAPAAQPDPVWLVASAVAGIGGLFVRRVRPLAATILLALASMFLLALGTMPASWGASMTSLEAVVLPIAAVVMPAVVVSSIAEARRRTGGPAWPNAVPALALLSAGESASASPSSGFPPGSAFASGSASVSRSAIARGSASVSPSSGSRSASASPSGTDAGAHRAPALPGEMFRRQAVAVLAVTAALAAIVVAAPLAMDRVHESVTVDADRLLRDAQAWIDTNLPKDSRVIVDDSIRVDLVRSGFDDDDLIGYRQLNASGEPEAATASEGQAPADWRDADYIVTTSSVRAFAAHAAGAGLVDANGAGDGSGDAAARSVSDAIANSTSVARFGSDGDRASGAGGDDGDGDVGDGSGTVDGTGIGAAESAGIESASESVDAGWVDIRRIATDQTDEDVPDARVGDADQVAAGRQLAANPALTLSDEARAQLTAGQVDSRIILILAQLLADRPMTISDFPLVAGENDDVRRQVLIETVDGRPAGEDAALQSWFAALEAPFAASGVDPSPGGLLVTFPPGEPEALLPTQP